MNHYSLAKYARFAWSGVARQGVLHCAADFLAEVRFDLRHGVETIIPRELSSLHPPGDIPAQAVQYQGANPRFVGGMLRDLPQTARAGTFVDIGCGKGRVLLLAAEAGFTRLEGVEFSPTLADAARRNLRRSRHLASNARWEVQTLDATRYSIPTGPVVLFLYNPFGGETLRRFLTNVRERLTSSPSPVWVVYLNPVGLEAFKEVGLNAIREFRRRGQLLGVLMEPAR